MWIDKTQSSTKKDIGQSLAPIRNQRGSIIIMMLFALLGCLAFAVIAIDVPVMLAARVQLQNAADAAALAGASGLLEGGENVAIERAIQFASMNGARFGE